MLRKPDALATSGSATMQQITSIGPLAAGHRMTARRRRQLFYAALLVALVLGLVVSAASLSNSTWLSLHSLAEGVDAPRWQSSTCDVPLFVAVLNDARYVEDIALVVRQHNERFAIDERRGVEHDPERRNLDCRRIVLHLLDNTGCIRHNVDLTAAAAPRRSRNVHRRTRLFESQVEHLHAPSDSLMYERIADGAAVESVQRFCQWWQNLTDQLLAGRQWSSPTGNGKSTPDVMLTRPLDGVASLTFGQSMNWMLSESAARYGVPWFLWMHTDTAILDFTVLHEILAVAADLEFVMREPFSYVLTQYDSLCLIHAAEIRQRVGFYDPFLWYYGEVELMLRAELAGVPMVQWPTSSSRVAHEGMSSKQLSGRQGSVTATRQRGSKDRRLGTAPRDHSSESAADDGYRQLEAPLERMLALPPVSENAASSHHMSSPRPKRSVVSSATRFQRMTEVKLALWKTYYEAKWETEFHFPHVSNTTIALGRVVLHPCTVPGARFGSVRAMVDSLGRALQSPTSLTIRGINLREKQTGDVVNRNHSNRSCSALPPSLRPTLADVEQFDFYFLPADAFQRWVDLLERRWHSPDGGGGDVAAAAAAKGDHGGAEPEDEFHAVTTQRGAHQWFGILRMDFFETVFDKK